MKPVLPTRPETYKSVWLLQWVQHKIPESACVTSSVAENVDTTQIWALSIYYTGRLGISIKLWPPLPSTGPCLHARTVSSVHHTILYQFLLIQYSWLPCAASSTMRITMLLLELLLTWVKRIYILNSFCEEMKVMLPPTDFHKSKKFSLIGFLRTISHYLFVFEPIFFLIFIRFSYFLFLWNIMKCRVSFVFHSLWKAI